MRLLTLPLLFLVLGGCVSTTVKRVERPELQVAERAEHVLLDVGIFLFDPNIPEGFEEREKLGIEPDVRKAEARYLPGVLRNTLENSGNWGAVRLIPRESRAVDLVIEGKIEESDGEALSLALKATDASGEVWVENTYSYRTSKYAYDPVAPQGQDPFQPLYVRFANDLAASLKKHSDDRLERLRLLSKIRFAQSFAPERFEAYLSTSADGRSTLRRLPAEGDSMMTRINRVREREYLFLDTLDQYYRGFETAMAPAYQDFRAFSYEEALAVAELQREARNRTIIGTVAVLGGIAAMAADDGAGRYAGALSVAGGAASLMSGIKKREEAAAHLHAIGELAGNLEEIVTPHIFELDEQTYTLTGTVDEQYDKWRTILGELYRAELGTAEP
jgi:hypothetical protein